MSEPHVFEPAVPRIQSRGVLRICMLWVALGVSAQSAALAQEQTAGARFGTRDPATCADTKEPTRGAPSAEVAKRYLRCHVEGVEFGSIFLLEDVNLQVGKGTPFLQLDLVQRPFGADPESLVYPIRGSYVRYQCSAPSAIMNNFGRNCRTYEHKRAMGQCFRSGFGDWTCSMIDANANNHPGNRTEVAPPR